jgi:hypothetical protein
MITLNVKLGYVIRVQTEFTRITAKEPYPLMMTYDTGAGTTTIDRKFALDSGYKIKKLRLSKMHRFGSAFVADRHGGTQ